MHFPNLLIIVNGGSKDNNPCNCWTFAESELYSVITTSREY